VQKAIGGAIRAALLAGLLSGACASAPRPEATTPPRVKDSAPEKIAAQRAASGGLQLDREDERWGIEAAQERKRIAAEKKQAQTSAAPATPTGPADLRRGPQGAPPPAPPPP
jgi:hypothetical protein